MSDSLQSFLLVVDSSQQTLNHVLEQIDDAPEIVNWQRVLPDAAVLVSPLSIADLNRVVKSKVGSQRYLLVSIERGKKQGWLPKESWTFMNTPKNVFDE